MRKFLVSSLFLIIFVCAANAQYNQIYIPPPPPLPFVYQYPQQPDYSPQVYSLLDQLIEVPPLSNYWLKYEFNRMVTITGEFSASGGRNDIDCIILSDFEYFNFDKGKFFRAYYRSGYVSSGKINIRLPAGIYFIIFNNRAALITNKKVRAKFEVQ